MAEDLLLPADWPARHTIEAAATRARVILLAGLPGVGKSLLIQQICQIAGRMARPVFLLQWDVARGAFETPSILARYPEVDGFTHAAIKRAAGLWSRAAVRRWHGTHPDPALLLAETPLVGGRLMELATSRDDEAEALLSSDAVQFLLPVPSPEVRAVIEAARARTIAAPRHERERADAAPNVLRALWEEIYRAGHAAGAVPAPPPGPIPYDPTAYRAVYLAWLRDRQVAVLEMDRLLPATRSVYEVGPVAGELTPSASEVDEIMRVVESTPIEEAR